MTRYAIDSDETTIRIEARSNLHPINSDNTGIEGYFEGEIGADGMLDRSSRVLANLVLPIAKLSSGNGLYDREMMRRVDARRYPTITAVLRKMSPGRTKGSYVAEGDITFRGVTRTVSDEVTLSTPEVGTIVFEGTHVFNLPDFDLQPPKIMMLRVYPDVTISVHIVAKAAT